MLNTDLPPMRPEAVVCPNSSCASSGRIGIHSTQERRYKCHDCGKTFSETKGTLLYGLKYPGWLVICILTLLAYGCPVQAIVMAFGLDERTVSDWQQKAGTHAKRVQEQLVCQGQIDLGQVQADELYVKMQGQRVWVATAMSVFSRLFLWGAVSAKRDTRLLGRVFERVRAAAKPGQPLLIAVDGLAAYVKVALRVFRDPQYTGRRGRPRLHVWSTLHVVQVLKRYSDHRLSTIERRLAHGSLSVAQQIVQQTQLTLGVINTAYIERLNATLRTWLPAFTRRSRTPARSVARLETAFFWTAVVYNFCRPHTSLDGTPAMAAGLTHHPWSIEELVRFRC